MGRIDIEAIRAIPDPEERYKTALSCFEKAREEAGKELAEELTEKGIPFVLAAERAEVDAGGFSRRLKGSFTLPPASLTKLCYSCLFKSVNQLLLGEGGVTMLPRALSTALKQLSKKGSSARIATLRYALQLREKDRNDNRLSIDIPFPTLLKERLQQLSDDKGIYPLALCGEDAPTSLKLCIRKAFESNDYVGRINTLLYISLVNNCSIDGLIAPNPVPNTQICYYGATQKDIIKDKNIRQIASIYYDLSSESKTELFVYLMNHHWESV